MTPPPSPSSTKRKPAVSLGPPTSPKKLKGSPAICTKPAKPSPLKNTLTPPPETPIEESTPSREGNVHSQGEDDFDDSDDKENIPPPKGMLQSAPKDVPAQEENALLENEGGISQENGSPLQENDPIGIEIASPREGSAPPPYKNNPPQDDKALPHNQNAHSQDENQSPQEDIAPPPNKSGQPQGGIASSQDQEAQSGEENTLPEGEKPTTPKEVTNQSPSKERHALPQQPSIAASRIVPPRKPTEDSVLALAKELGYTTRKELYDFLCTPTLLHPIIEYHHTKFKIIEKAPHMRPKLQRPIDFGPEAIGVMAAQDPKYIYDRYDIEKITTHRDNQLRFMCRLIFEIRLLNGCGENSHLAEPEICRLISEIMRVTEREFWELHRRIRGSELVNVLRKSAQAQGIEVLAKVEKPQTYKRKAPYTPGEGSPRIKKAMMITKGTHVSEQSQKIPSPQPNGQRKPSPAISAVQKGKRPDAESKEISKKDNSSAVRQDTDDIKKSDAINTTSNTAAKQKIVPEPVMEAGMDEMMAAAGIENSNKTNDTRQFSELKMKEVQRGNTDVMMHRAGADDETEDSSGHRTDSEKKSLMVKLKMPKERVNNKGLTEAAIMVENPVGNDDTEEKQSIDIDFDDELNFERQSLIVKFKTPRQGIYNNTMNGAIRNDNDTSHGEIMSTRPEAELKIVKDLIDYDTMDDSDSETFFEAPEKMSFASATKPAASQSFEEQMEHASFELPEDQALTGIDATMMDADEFMAEWCQDDVEEYGSGTEDEQMSDIFSSRAPGIEAANSTNAEPFNMSVSEGLQAEDPTAALMFPEEDSFNESAFDRGYAGDEEDVADIFRLREFVGLEDGHMNDHRGEANETFDSDRDATLEELDDAVEAQLFNESSHSDDESYTDDEAVGNESENFE